MLRVLREGVVAPSGPAREQNDLLRARARGVLARAAPRDLLARPLLPRLAARGRVGGLGGTQASEVEGGARGAVALGEVVLEGREAG